jgi:hypothetical protein
LLRRFAELTAELHTMCTQDLRLVPFKSTRFQFAGDLVMIFLFYELRIAGLTVVQLLYPGLACSRMSREMVSGTPLRSSVYATSHGGSRSLFLLKHVLEQNQDRQSG